MLLIGIKITEKYTGWNCILLLLLNDLNSDRNLCLFLSSQNSHNSFSANAFRLKVLIILQLNFHLYQCLRNYSFYIRKGIC